MTGTWRDTWSWRARIVWALLGPVLVLTVEVETVLVVLDGLGRVFTGPDLHGWSTLVAGVLLMLVAAAQVATGLRGHLSATRRAVAEIRRELEEKLLAHGSTRELPPREPPVSVGSSLRPATRLRSARFLAAGVEQIIGRFELEPSWALRQLDENLRVPAARRLSIQARLADSRWAGHATASLFALVLIPAMTIIEAPAGYRDPTGPIVLGALLVLVFMGELLATMRAGGEVVTQELRYYQEVEALLELHRFELYRALALPMPSDSEEERGGGLAAWRLGKGNIAFEQPGDHAEGEARTVPAESARPGQLVPYEGFVSWAAGDNGVELAFGRAPVLDGGHARLQVGGTDTASHAPFDITADSNALDLLQVRASVQAPVDGRTVRRSFDFTRTTDAGPEPELWLEISQRGRFVQLLRVRTPHRSRS